MHPASLQLSRRQLLRAALLVGGTVTAGAAAAACSPAGRPTGGSGASTSDDTVTIGFVPIACSAPLLATHALDLFAQHGVNVELKKYAGWADLWTAYATGALDVAHMLSPMPIAIDAGATNATRATELSFTQNTNGQALTLAAAHHPHVREVTDLEGMVLGIPFEYSVHALLLRDYLHAGGLDSVRDVELRLLRPADMVAQLEVQTIDGFIGPEPFLQRALATGSGRIFELTKDMWDKHPCCCVAMANDFRAGRPETAAGIVAALHEGAAFVDNPAHVGKAAPLLAQEKYLNQSADFIAPALAGNYLSWEGEEITDPEYLSFGDPTSATAITWMAAQLARFDLGGDHLTWDDEIIIAAARGVLPADADHTAPAVTINGNLFDPAHPTASYPSQGI